MTSECSQTPQSTFFSIFTPLSPFLHQKITTLERLKGEQRIINYFLSFRPNKDTFTFVLIVIALRIFTFDTEHNRLRLLS